MENWLKRRKRRRNIKKTLTNGKLAAATNQYGVMHSVEHTGYTPKLRVVANRSLKINPSMEIRIKRNETYSTIDITSWLRGIIGPFGT